MALHGIALEATKDFQSSFDPDIGTPSATTFKLRTLDSRVMGYLRDKFTKFTRSISDPDDDAASTQVNVNEVAFEAAQFGIETITNFKDGGGNDIEMKTKVMRLGGKPYKVIDADIIRRLDTRILLEIYRELTTFNQLTEAEAKN